MTSRDQQQPPAAGRDSRGTVFNLAGTTLGKYRLIEKVGQGGMAQVYQAYQPDLDRYVAVKVLHPHLIGDEDFVARFRREARVVAGLEHPHIVRVYDFDADGDVAFWSWNGWRAKASKRLCASWTTKMQACHWPRSRESLGLWPRH